MIYVEVNFNVAAKDQQAAIACLADEVPQMRALPGNCAVRVLTDPADNGAITLLHQWDDLSSLDAYRSGPLFASVGRILRPLMTAPPSTAVYQAQLLD